MIIKNNNLLNIDEGKKWDAFNEKHNCHSIYQSSIWAKYLKNSKIPYQAFEIYNSCELKIAQNLCWLEPPSILSRRNVPPLILYLLNKISPRLCWKDGPVIASDNIQDQDDITSFLVKQVKEERILSGICPFRLKGNEKLLNKCKIADYGTYIINLEKSESILYNNLKSSAKKNLKKSILNIRFLENNELPLYNKLLKEYRAKLKLPVPLHAGNKELQKACMGNAFYHHLGAFEGNNLIGALGLLGYKKKLIETGVARKTGSKSDTVAQDHIKWFIIKNGAMWGFNEFDLSGFDPNDLSEKGIGIRRFKEKWGGEVKVFTHLKRRECS